jgi:hypothetical protein
MHRAILHIMRSFPAIMHQTHDTFPHSCDAFPCLRLVCILAHLCVSSRCRDSILYRLVLAYFTAHDDWASQHNITIMCRAIPHIMRSFPAITRQTQDTFLHSRNAFPRSRLAHVLVHLHVLSCIFTFHCAYSCFIPHLRVSSRIFTFHHDLVRIIAGASIHCPASSLVRHIPFITISDYVWHRTIIISLWTLTLPHLHT